MVNDKTLLPTNVVYTTHDWHDTIDAVRSIVKVRWNSWYDRSFLTYQLTMASHVETSWCPYQLFHRTFTIDLTASIVSCQSCVVYTTFVGNSVLSFTTSELKNNCNTNFRLNKHFLRSVGIKSSDNTNFSPFLGPKPLPFERKVPTFEFSKAPDSTKSSLKSIFLCRWSFLLLFEVFHLY